MGIKRSLCLLGLLLFFVSIASALPPNQNDKDYTQDYSASLDNSVFLDANNILMFITNHGNYGRDLDDFFGYDYGTFYPYIDTQYIRNGYTRNLAPLYAAGLWLGGVNQDGDTLLAISEYASEYVPGPMLDGTYQSDRSEFRVYKLYADSLGTNGNADYWAWPSFDQGAPTNSAGKPAMKGDQMVWTVFNDANPASHDGRTDAGMTSPTGIEVQMTAWAYDSPGDFEYSIQQPVIADHIGPSDGSVIVNIVDPGQMTGHDYMVTFDEPNPGEIVWYLIDLTTTDTVLFNQTNQSGDNNYAVVDGLQVVVSAPAYGIKYVEEVFSGGSPVDPPDNVMYSTNSTNDWYISADIGNDITRFNWQGNIGTDDWEIRFTANGSNYYDWSTDILQPDRAPFEVWNIGSGTPDDNSDDQQINFSFIDDDDNGVWSWGDRFYFWEQPYVEPAPASPPYVWPDDLTVGRILFRDFSGNLTHPTVGTIVRLTSEKTPTNLPADTFTFTPPAVTSAMTGGEGNAIYIEYKIYNRGPNNFDEFYTASWSDPDIGILGDDRIGCDTLTSTFFCYNENNTDPYYGSPVPALGFRLIAGPMVPSNGDSALFYDHWVADYKNLPMTAFCKFINGTDPDDYQQTYQYFHGLLGYDAGNPYTFLGKELKFMHSGDPVTGSGDLDFEISDKRMLGVSGPVTLHSGDSQYVLLKFAIGHGNNNLESITKLRAILGIEDIVLDAPEGPNTLPDKYSLSVNYPNPFNPSTTIEYNLPRKSQVALAVFNILGRQVKTLVDQTESPGRHSAVWDGTNDDNEAVASGIYFYRLRADQFSQTRKMMLLK